MAFLQRPGVTHGLCNMWKLQALTTATARLLNARRWPRTTRPGTFGQAARQMWYRYLRAQIWCLLILPIAPGRQCSGWLPGTCQRSVTNHWNGTKFRREWSMQPCSLIASVAESETRINMKKHAVSRIGPIGEPHGGTSLDPWPDMVLSTDES